MHDRFESEEWMTLTPVERVKQCCRFSVEAIELAKSASTKKRKKEYLMIAGEWLVLAEEING